MKRSLGVSVALGLAAVAAPLSPAAAARAPAARAPVLQEVFDCKRLTDAQLRLACYDRAAGALDAAEVQGEVVVIDRAQSRVVRRQAFGLAMSSLNLFSRGDKEETLSRISVPLSGAHQGGDGKWVFVTNDDQVWRQTDSETISRPPRAGSNLAVRKAAMGSFFCNVDGQYAVRCERGR